MSRDSVIDLPTERESEAIAKRMALCFATTPLTCTFSGEIGAGKTTLIRAFLRQLGVTGPIKSPTYALVESYSLGVLQIHHFDLYRIQDDAELDYIGFRDYFTNDAICCIEWPERVPHYLSYLNVVDVSFSIAIKGSGRVMQCRACSSVGAAWLSKMIRELV